MASKFENQKSNILTNRTQFDSTCRNLEKRSNKATMNIEAGQKNATQVNPEEDGEWMAKQQIFKAEKEGCFPCFNFRKFPSFKKKEISGMVISLICTLRHVECINLLSPASLMEIGMCMAFCENDDFGEDGQIRNVIQHVAWDCVAAL